MMNMDITSSMLQMPPFLMFILLVALGGILAGGGTILFRKFVSLKVLRSHNEVTGFLFLAIASFYALLLSFVVFVVWGQMNQTHSNASKEGSSAMALYRDIKFYPDTTESRQMMVVYLEFINNILTEEYTNTEVKVSSRKTAESFNMVFHKMERLNPHNQFQIQLVGEMFNHLNELATFRGFRTGSLETKIPHPMWYPLLLGAIISIFCAMLLDIEHARLHIGLNTLLGAIIGMFFFIIILLDHPYMGTQRIKPKSYEQINILEGWSKEADPVN
jgi:ABC-type multidrug transport system fused ATPase/permease subunit